MKSPCFLSSPGLLGLIFISWLVVLPKAFSDDASAPDHQVFEHCSDSESHTAQPFEPLEYSTILYVTGSSALFWAMRWAHELYTWKVAEQYLRLMGQDANAVKPVVNKDGGDGKKAVEDVATEVVALANPGGLKILNQINERMKVSPMSRDMYFIATISALCIAVHMFRNPERSLELAADIIGPVFDRAESALSVVWTDARSAGIYIFQASESGVVCLWHAGESVVMAVWHTGESVAASLWHTGGFVVSSVWHAGESAVASVWHTGESAVSSVWHHGSESSIRRGLVASGVMNSMYYTHRFVVDYWRFKSLNAALDKKSIPQSLSEDTSPALRTVLFMNALFLAVNQAIPLIPTLFPGEGSPKEVSD